MSSQQPIESKTYLGDGLYAKIENGMIKLSCERLNPTESAIRGRLVTSEHYVYLDSEVLANFDKWRKELGLA